VVVGGVALVGTGRLCVAAGAYVGERVRERAALCSHEYERYQRLRAQAMALAAAQARQGIAPLGPQATVLPRQTIKPVFDRSRLSRFHEDTRTATTIVERLEQDMDTHQAQAQVRLQQIEQRAYLEAMLAMDKLVLAPKTAAVVRAALNSSDASTLAAAMEEMHRALAQLRQDEREGLHATLGNLDSEAGGLLAVAADPQVRDDLVSIRRRIGHTMLSGDVPLLRVRIEEFDRELGRLRERHERAMGELRAVELAGLWGLLQAVGGLFSDIQSLVNSGQVTIDESLLKVLGEIGERHQALERGDIVDLTALRDETAKLTAMLYGLQEQGTTILNRYYQQRLADEVEQSLAAMTQGAEPHFTTIARAIETDGTMTLRGQQGPQTLEIKVRPDGRLKYEAYGYGDERCLGAVYALLDQLADRGVLLGAEEPELTRQAAIVSQVITAIRQLGSYTDPQIRVYEDAAATVIEAGSGFTRVQVGEDGRITELPTLVPTGTGPATIDIIEKAKTPAVKQETEQRITAIRDRRQRQRT
jgi:hypothetical protein